jgi:uncharacterized peroxidase-related enzyme
VSATNETPTIKRGIIMARLNTIDIAQATGPAANLFKGIKGAIGMVPNAFATIGTNSPVALEAFLNFDAAVGKSSLSAKEIETVKLVVSAVAGCDYCLAAHTMIGKKSGLGREQILAFRRGDASGDARMDALAAFARSLVTTRGTVSEAAIAQVKAAGFSDAQITDTLLAIAAITFTNLLNRVNDTVLDFPAAD